MNSTHAGVGAEPRQQRPGIARPDPDVADAEPDETLGGQPRVFSGELDAQVVVRWIADGRTGQKQSLARADLELHGMIMIEEGAPAERI